MVNINVIVMYKKKYYYFDSFETLNQAKKIANEWKDDRKSKYVIIQYEEGGFSPKTKYALYLTKVIRLFA